MNLTVACLIRDINLQHSDSVGVKGRGSSIITISTRGQNAAWNDMI